MLDEILQQHRVEVPLQSLILQRTVVRQRNRWHPAHPVEFTERQPNLRPPRLEMRLHVNALERAVFGEGKRPGLKFKRPSAQLALHFL